MSACEVDVGQESELEGLDERATKFVCRKTFAGKMLLMSSVTIISFLVFRHMQYMK